MKLLSITDIPLHHQRVLIREDFNVPMINGQLTSESRIRAALPTIEYALSQQAAVILLSHLGRPQSSSTTENFSLAPVAPRLAEYLNRPVKFISNWIDGVNVHPGEVVLCENVRFQAGEESNDIALSKKIAQLADIIVMDAFAVAHRTAASTVGMIHYAKQACCGLLLQKELTHLSNALNNPHRPLIALIGGAKISTKLLLLSSLIPKIDHLLLGGALANTFLVAQGINIGASLYESNLIEAATQLLQTASASHCTIHLPQDAVVQSSEIATQLISHIGSSDRILDIGPKTAQHYADCLKTAGTILWNGPMGMFEKSEFQAGTAMVAQAVHDSAAFSIAGGGETVAAVEQFNITPSYLSTGGGAFLAFLEGKPLPAIQALHDRQTGAFL